MAVATQRSRMRGNLVQCSATCAIWPAAPAAASQRGHQSSRHPSSKEILLLFGVSHCGSEQTSSPSSKDAAPQCDHAHCRSARPSQNNLRRRDHAGLVWRAARDSKPRWAENSRKKGTPDRDAGLYPATAWHLSARAAALAPSTRDPRPAGRTCAGTAATVMGAGSPPTRASAGSCLRRAPPAPSGRHDARACRDRLRSSSARRHRG